MRHDFAGEGDVFELVEGDGFDEEGDVGFAGLNERDGFGGFAEVLDAAECADFFFGEAEDMVEDYGVKLGNSQLALFCRETCEERGDGLGFWGEEVVAVASDGEEGVGGGVGQGIDEIGRGRLVFEFGDGVVGARFGNEIWGGEVFDALNDAMRGQDGNAGGVHVDEGHHHGGFGESGDRKRAGADPLVFVERLVEGKLELGASLFGIRD